MSHFIDSVKELSANYSLSKKEENVLKNACKILEAKMRDTANAQEFTSLVETKRAARLYFTITHCSKDREVFSVAYLDNQHRLIEIVDEFFGTIDGASVYPREVVKRALKLGAAAVIFMHNHPSGKLYPSESDRSITRQLTNALSMVDVRVLDHIIVGQLSTYSFAESGIL